ncbi:MAG: S-layer homology domain-containing protein [Defluviitaleaceae bacterium]|nr:S-layer homology domain-containing protein [Defluviitaleaceae bacterium]
MFKKPFMQAICFALVLILIIPAISLADEPTQANGTNAAANTAASGQTEDALILTDPVNNEFVGRLQANRLIQQLQFTDLPENNANREVIIRGGALEIMHPTQSQFRPTAPITNEEAISYALSAAGLSELALTMAEAQPDLPEGTPVGAAWAMGYLQLASTMGMLQPDDYTAALAELTTAAPAADEADEAPEIATENLGFNRTAAATREDVAFWVAEAMLFAGATFTANTAGVSARSFTDWNTISANRFTNVERLLRSNVMNGQTAALYAPKSSVTRQEMAQIIRNLDNVLYQTMGLERRIGVVADITSEQYTETGAGILWHHVHVRRADGSVDILRHTLSGSPSPQQTGPLDAVVFRGGYAMGLNSLEVSDQIEYIIEPATGTIWYVNVTNTVVTQTFRGRLEIIDMDNGTMTFRNNQDRVFTFPMSRGLYGNDHNNVPFIRFKGNQLAPAAGLPRGAFYDAILVGNVITAIEFVGQEVLVPENRGLVVEIDPQIGYLTILDANRKEQSFTFNTGQLKVHRRPFYDMRDTIGGLHEMFPLLHPREADISDVIPGDIVVFVTADDDPLRIVELNAAENTTSRYGRVREIRNHGGYFDMLMEFNNGQSMWYTVVDGILTLENGRPVSPDKIQLGDYARLTVNQAILAPGVMMESVREINLDTGGHHISAILTGQIGGYNAAQNTLQIQNARQLTPDGWRNHSPLVSQNISGSNVRYFLDGRAVTLAHVNRYLQRSDSTVYIAMENHFAGQRAAMVSVRTGRDELVRAGTVLSSANNAFSLLELPGSIQTDAGTIVVRNGRLVEQGHISAPDWARVALNGGTAAVVDIGAAPATSGVQIVRGRINRVWPFEGFRVETMSLFDGFRWNFTPIEREFTIDHNTLFINESGVTSIDDFIGYTDASVIGDTYTVIVEGGRAVRVIDAPFTEPIPQTANASGHLAMRGIIYSANGNTLELRDVTVFNPATGGWDRISVTNPTASITAQPNTVIVDRNQVIGASGLQAGQQILAFTNVRRNEVTLAPNMSADAYIVLVEN